MIMKINLKCEKRAKILSICLIIITTVNSLYYVQWAMIVRLDQEDFSLMTGLTYLEAIVSILFCIMLFCIVLYRKKVNKLTYGEKFFTWVYFLPLIALVSESINAMLRTHYGIWRSNNFNYRLIIYYVVISLLSLLIFLSLTGKKKITFLTIAICMIMGFSAHLYYRSFNRIQNVFEQMHYEGQRLRENTNYFTIGAFEDMEQLEYRYFPITHIPSVLSPIIRHRNWNDPITTMYYHQYFLEENQQIRIEINESWIYFQLIIEFPETNETLVLSYSYFLKGRLLRRNKPLTLEFSETNETLGFSHSYFQRGRLLRENNPHVNANECTWNTSNEACEAFFDRHQLTHGDIENLYHWFLQDRILFDWFNIDGLSTEFSMDNLGNFTFEEINW